MFMPPACRADPHQGPPMGLRVDTGINPVPARFEIAESVQLTDRAGSAVDRAQISYSWA